MPTVNELLDRAKGELSNLLHGEVFLLRDLFKGFEWNRIFAVIDCSLVPYF